MSLVSSRPVRRARTGILQISLAGVLWGTGGLVVHLIRDITPMSVLTLSAYRMAIAAVALLAAVLLLRRGDALRRLVAERPVHAAAVGCGTAAYQALYFGSVVTAGVSVATVVTLGLAPVVLTIAECVTARRLVSGSRLVVLAMALGGLVLVGAAAGGVGTRPVLGVGLAVASGVTYAVTTAGGRSLAQRADPLVLATAATTAGALALLPFGLLAGLSAPLVTTDPVALAWLLYLGVFTMALSYGLLYAGLRTTPGSVAVVASLLEPVTAAIAASLLLGERLGPAGLVGTVLLLAAVAGLDGDGAGRAVTREVRR
jgi:DME family drug/metabolite transporter